MSDKMIPPFWVVWNPRGPYPPSIQYPTRQAAQRAAQAMARRCLGEYFYVLKMQSCHQVQRGMVNFMAAGWGVGAPCQFHGSITKVLPEQAKDLEYSAFLG